MDNKQQVAFRKRTGIVAQMQGVRLDGILRTFAPQLRPSAMVGDVAGSGAKGAAQPGGKVAEVVATFHEVIRQKPYSDNRELNQPVELPSSGRVEVTPLQYRHEIRTTECKQTLRVVAPLTWVPSFPGYGLNHLESALARGEEPEIRRYVFNNVLLNFIVTRQPALIDILEGLLYRVSTIMLPEFGSLPITCIASVLRTVRLPDENLIEMIELTGVDQTREVMDVTGADLNICDPFREKLLAALHGSDDGSRAVA